MNVDQDRYEMARTLDRLDGIPTLSEWETEEGERKISEWEQEFSQQYLAATKGL